MKLPWVEKAAVWLMPWLELPEPPVQVAKVTVPVVPVIQESVLIDAPCDPVPEAVEAPLTEIVSVVLVTELEEARLVPTLAWVPEAEPVIEMGPLPVVVEMAPRLLIFTPCEGAVVLAPPVPMSVKEPPPCVLTVPSVMVMP